MKRKIELIFGISGIGLALLIIIKNLLDIIQFIF